jgi:Fe2+ or Zn2+ uptake regulation protein
MISTGCGTLVPVSDLLERLRIRGWRLTAQRRTVAEALQGRHVHLTADEVLARATTLLPEVSRATVYNTLGELVAMGEVRQVNVGAGPTRYDPNASVHHDHLVCDGCGLILDVDADPSGQTASAGERHQFEVTATEIIYRGRCRTCQTVSDAPTSPPAPPTGPA